MSDNKQDPVVRGRALLEKVTPGKWEADFQAQFLSGDVYRIEAEGAQVASDVGESDAALIVAAPELIADLIAIIDAQRRDLDESEALREKLADILTRTANALRGDPGPLAMHGWADLPERAAAARDVVEVARRREEVVHVPSEYEWYRMTPEQRETWERERDAAPEALARALARYDAARRGEAG